MVPNFELIEGDKKVTFALQFLYLRFAEDMIRIFVCFKRRSKLLCLLAATHLLLNL